MARRWMKNVPTSTKNVQTQHLYWFLTWVCDFGLVDVDSTANYTNITQATDGICSTTNPAQFQIPTTNPYGFSSADVGRFVAIRDDVNPKNSGIFPITSVPNTKTVNLNGPVANFVADSTSLKWTLYDATAAPADDSWFVIQSKGTLTWQAKVTCKQATTPFGLAVELATLGGWDTGSNTWLLPASAKVSLYNATFLTFCVADELTGAFFVWCDDAAYPANGVTGIYCGEFSALHSPQGAGVPGDYVTACLIGDNSGSPDSMSRSTTAPSFNVGGQVMNLEQSGYVQTWFHSWVRLVDNTDPFANGGNVNPRSTLSDTFNFVVYQTNPSTQIRGFLPLLRMCKNGILNRTTINSANFYTLKNGVAVEWDGSTPS